MPLTGFFGVVLVALVGRAFERLAVQQRQRGLSSKTTASRVTNLKVIPKWEDLRQLLSSLEEHLNAAPPGERLYPPALTDQVRRLAELSIREHISQVVGDSLASKTPVSLGKVTGIFEALLGHADDTLITDETLEKHLWTSYSRKVAGPWIDVARDCLNSKVVREFLDSLCRLCRAELDGPADDGDTSLPARSVQAFLVGAGRPAVVSLAIRAGLRTMQEHKNGDGQRWLLFEHEHELHVARALPFVETLMRRLAAYAATGTEQKAEAERSSEVVRSAGTPTRVAGPMIPDRVPPAIQSAFIHAAMNILKIKQADFMEGRKRDAPWSVDQLLKNATQAANAKLQPGCEISPAAFVSALLSFSLRWDPMFHVRYQLDELRQHMPQLEGAPLPALMAPLERLYEALNVICDPCSTGARDAFVAEWLALRSDECPPVGALAARFTEIEAQSQTELEPGDRVLLALMEQRAAAAAAYSIGRQSSVKTDKWLRNYGVVRPSTTAVWHLLGYRRRVEAGTPEPLAVQRARALEELYTFVRAELLGYESTAAVPSHRIARHRYRIHDGLREIVSAPSPDPDYTLGEAIEGGECVLVAFSTAYLRKEIIRGLRRHIEQIDRIGARDGEAGRHERDEP